MKDQEYAGFWIRLGASIIDSILVMFLIFPLTTVIYGKEVWTSGTLVAGFWDVIVSYVLPAIAIIVFWIYKSATPGKMLTNLTIVDAKTGGKPSTGQFIGRYLSYYISMLPLFLGFFWVAFDRRKQGWHDKLAGTVVVRNAQTEADEYYK